MDYHVFFIYLQQLSADSQSCFIYTPPLLSTHIILMQSAIQVIIQFHL